MKKRYSSKDISLVRNRQIFFDANVILYVFWPTGQYIREQQYSSIFGQLIKQNNCVLLTNDKDFTESDIEILTSNPALLRNNV